MNDREIEAMSELEGRHWWYRGLRDMIAATLSMPRFAVPRGARVLDAGCGTGENLRLLRRLVQPSYCGGFDISSRAVSLCQEKIGPDVDVYVSDIRCPAVHVDPLDLILSCDVLSIAGLEDSMAGLRSLVAKLRLGGVFIVNLAALRWLYSSHDVIINVRDRVTAPRLCRFLTAIGLRVELLTYRVFWLFPLIVLRRLPSMLARPKPGRAHSDLAPTATWINELLFRSLRTESWMASRGFRFPWGSSLFAVGRKDGAS